MSLLEEYIAREVSELRDAGRTRPDPGRPRPADRRARAARSTGSWRRPAAATGWRSTCASPTAPAPRSCARRGCWRRTSAAGRLDPAEIDEEARRARGSTPREWPDPDLLIRTSGEMRISNFLLWQLAYAELYVTPGALARLHPAAPLRGDPRVPAARPPVRPRPGLMASELARRIGFAAVAIPLALLLVWYGGLPARRRCVAVAAALGPRELFGLAERQRRPAGARGLGIATAAALAAADLARAGRADIGVRLAGAAGPMPRRSG